MPTRRYQRVPLRRVIGLRKPGQAGDPQAGMTIDFSPEGCAIQHETLALHCGMRVKLRLALPDRQDCVEIDQAIVTWTRKHQCGIRFMALTQEDQARIKMVYEMLLEAQAGETDHDSPPVITLQPIPLR